MLGFEVGHFRDVKFKVFKASRAEGDSTRLLSYMTSK